jgi:hypothetical protein
VQRPEPGQNPVCSIRKQHQQDGEGNSVKGRSTVFGSRVLLVCLVCALLQGRSADGATGALAWEQTFRQDLAGSGLQYPLAARELAAGTRMVMHPFDVFPYRRPSL